MEQERRIRREIANSNERRRMQSINAGFQSLRTLLPHNEGEKLSKAAILQQTAQYIYQLEQEKTRLLSQNCQMKRHLNQQNHDSDGGSSVDSPLPKRKKSETVESGDEGIGSMSPNINESNLEELKKEMIELRVQLERERRLRMMMEEQTRNLEAQLYPERIREIAHQVHLQYQRQQSEDESSPHPNTNLSADSRLTVVEESGQTNAGNNTARVIEGTTTITSVRAAEEKRDASFGDLSTIKQEMDEDSNSENPTEHLHEDSNPMSPFSLALQRPIPHDHTLRVITQQQPQTPSGMYSTSRQNLETIVEAIRHLEGDHLFNDDEPTMLTRRNKSSEDGAVESENVVSRSPSPNKTLVSNIPHSAQQSHLHHHQHHHVMQHLPSRPGVIVSAHT